MGMGSCGLVLPAMCGCANAGEVGRSVGVGKSEMNVTTLLLGNFNTNVYGWVEYIDLRIRDVNFDMGETEAFLFSIQPHGLGNGFVQSIYAVGRSA